MQASLSDSQEAKHPLVPNCPETWEAKWGIQTLPSRFVQGALHWRGISVLSCSHEDPTSASKTKCREHIQSVFSSVSRVLRQWLQAVYGGATRQVGIHHRHLIFQKVPTMEAPGRAITRG